MSDGLDTRTNSGYKYSWIIRHSGEIISYTLLGLFLFVNYNWIQDSIDRRNFCSSLFPLNSFNEYQDNKLHNEYCYNHIEEYNYQDRYWDIPVREYN